MRKIIVSHGGVLGYAKVADCSANAGFCLHVAFGHHPSEPIRSRLRHNRRKAMRLGHVSAMLFSGNVMMPKRHTIRGGESADCADWKTQISQILEVQRSS